MSLKIWLHGVSVGESNANLTIAKALLETYKDSRVLLTSTTKTSASLIQKHVSERLAYAPYPMDFPWRVKKFLNAHKPDIAIFGESELWPIMLGAMKKRGIPAALINARMSEKSFKRWRLFSWLSKHMLATFSIVLAQSNKEAARYKILGAEHVEVSGNLKFAADPLPYKEPDLDWLRTHIKDRPVLLFAQTHTPEEAMAERVQNALKQNHPNLLSIIVPRHPERGPSIAKDLNVSLAVRSKGETITPKTEIYLADTLGELGLFYRLCPITVLCNSFTTTPGGGHNPIEPAHLDTAIIYGPEMFNFALIDEEMRTANAVRQCPDETALISAITDMMEMPEERTKLIKNAKAYAQSKANVLPEILEKLAPLIDTALSEA